MLSQISRGSKVKAASIVRITTVAKATAPRLASTLAIRPKFTTATKMAMTKMSSMDQRPMNSMNRYIKMRCRADKGWRRCTEYNNKPMPTSLKVGTRILAMNTTAAMGTMPCLSRVMTPDMIVSGLPCPNVLTVMIGSTLAGMYRIEAAMSSAQVRTILLGRRACTIAPQRVQVCDLLSESCRFSS
ncbi:hypothetical protein D3C81_1658950 [compost metagenome]